MNIKTEIITRSHGIYPKVYSFLRLAILPIEKIDEIVPKEGKIMDYGCGFGTNSCYLALSSEKRRVVGIEHNEKRVNKARALAKNIKNLNFEVGDVSKIRIADANTHLLIDIMHHMPYEKQIILLKKIARTVKRGNLIIIKDIDNKPFLKYLWNYIHDKIMTFNEKLYFRNRKWFGDFLKGHGMKVKSVRCWNLLYPHFVVVARK